MTIKTTPFDAAKYLTDPEDHEELLAEAFESGNEDFIKVALATVARARGMAATAQDASMTRPGLYKSLSEAGDPKLSTLLSLVKALGYQVTIRKAEAAV